ncbi:hypothetical protein [Lentzea flava]|uniref:Uncharacterized protein n=1 Tax=Lentzea flava TaxID=103732 RepID=A0ABQ2UNV1_9PSEU|nr:hypothetical protein [Lentzea flava]MCP2200934.1 hypothetical protein [Lentzea flava]GGU46975.1 hypothetical protein GCM10010178_44310 [Lentzea flava]
MNALDLGAVTQMQRLRHLHQVRGWSFDPVRSPDPPHELVELIYSFCHGQWLDVLRVRSDTDAQAGRFLAESMVGGGCPRACWLAAGALADVLDGLDELPPPMSRLAPRLLLPAIVR